MDGRPSVLRRREGVKRLEIEYVDHALLGEPSDDEDYGDDSDGESDGGLWTFSSA